MQTRPIEVPIALLVLVLLWLVWLRWQRRTVAIRALSTASGLSAPSSAAAGARSLLAAGAILAVASVSAVGAAIALPPTADRTVLRTTAEIPFDPRDLVSPLSGFRAFWQEPTADRLLLSVDGLPDGTLVRIATLDTYDGVVYSVGSAQVTTESGSFSRVPSAVDQSRIEGDQRHQSGSASRATPASGYPRPDGSRRSSSEVPVPRSSRTGSTTTT